MLLWLRKIFRKAGMTQSISADHTSEIACRVLAEPSIPVMEPSINIIVALLTRVFLGVTGGDPDLARLGKSVV